ncbi:MAG TPA: hypothetical protein DGU45_03115 [Planctomycetes bacterium]|nr:hypothetical protein [Planctomycetota bacterium]
MKFGDFSTDLGNLQMRPRQALRQWRNLRFHVGLLNVTEMKFRSSEKSPFGTYPIPNRQEQSKSRRRDRRVSFG